MATLAFNSLTSILLETIIKRGFSHDFRDADRVNQFAQICSIVKAKFGEDIKNKLHRHQTPEAVSQRCSIKRCSQKFRKIYKKTPMLEPVI